MTLPDRSVTLVGRCLASRRAQSGESLVEVLLTILIMGVALLAFLSLMFSVTVSSAAQRRSVLAGNIATSVAEQLERVDYVPCTTGPWPPATYTAALGLAPATAGDSTGGYSPTLTYRYLTKASTTAAATSADFQTSCPTADGDQGLQEITVTVDTKSTPGGKAKIVMVKRDNRCSRYGGYTALPGQTC